MGFFSIIAKLGADTSEFDSKTDKSIALVKGKLARAFTGAALLAFTKSVMSAADNIGDLAEQTAETTDEVQRLIAIASAKGLDFGQIQQFIFHLQKARTEAMSGNAELAHMFAQIGIPQDKLASLKTAKDLLAAVTSGAAQFNDSDRVNILSTLGGQKAGPKMQAALAEIAGGGGGDALTFTKGQINEFSQAQDNFDSGLRMFKVLGGAVIGGVNMMFRDLANFITPGDTKNRKWAGPTAGALRAAQAAPAPSAPKLVPFADIQKLAEAEKIEEDIAERTWQARLKTLTVDKQRAILLREIVDLQEQAAGLDEEGTPAAKLLAAQLRDRANKLELERLGLKNTPDRPDLNQFQRIGAFVAGTQTDTTPRQQLTALQLIQQNTKKLVDAARYSEPIP